MSREFEDHMNGVRLAFERLTKERDEALDRVERVHDRALVDIDSLEAENERLKEALRFIKQFYANNNASITDPEGGEINEQMNKQIKLLSDALEAWESFSGEYGGEPFTAHKERAALASLANKLTEAITALKWVRDNPAAFVLAREETQEFIRTTIESIDSEEPEYVDPGPDPQHVDPEWLARISRIKANESPPKGATRNE